MGADIAGSEGVPGADQLDAGRAPALPAGHGQDGPGPWEVEARRGFGANGGSGLAFGEGKA